MARSISNSAPILSSASLARWDRFAAFLGRPLSRIQMTAMQIGRNDKAKGIAAFICLEVRLDTPGLASPEAIAAIQNPVIQQGDGLLQAVSP